MDEKKQIIGFIRVMLVAIAFVVFTAAWLCDRCRPPIIVHVCVPDPNWIPSIEHVQRALKNKDNPRYDPGPIDSKVGPLLKEGWENWDIDKYANQEFDNVQ